MTAPKSRRRLALVLEYDGSPFAGSQVQKRTPSVQGTLETAVRKLTGERLRVAFAGRTDAGVHARGQVAAFTTASSLPVETFGRGLNAWLPQEIAVRRAVEVPAGFDPRRDATGRTYRYTIYNHSVRSPLWRRSAWQVAGRLDVAAMQRAARALVGRHDFAAFSRREDTTTIRRVRRCDIAGQGLLITVEMEAKAFLRQQVRRTVGALVQVGKGRLSPAGLRDLLRKAEPASAGPLAPPQGLCLLRVDYPRLDLSGPDAL